MTAKLSLHEKITNQMLEAMESATSDFILPWHSSKLELPTNAFTKNTYQGINAVSLWTVSMQQSYSSNTWCSYKQWQSMGGQVRKGQKGCSIVIYKPVMGEDDEALECDTCSVVDKFHRALVGSVTVFNADQVHGWEGSIEAVTPLLDKAQKLEQVDYYINNTEAMIIHANRAYYDTANDCIAIPERQCFKETATSTATEAYYSTLVHEIVHWSGKSGRSARDLSGRFGSDRYAMEELIAELGSAFLCAELGVSVSPRQDHANYLSSWIKVLQGDSKAIFYAAARASEATAYLNSLQPRKL